MPDVLMPRLSDTMTEGVVSQWLKAEGDEVQRGDVLAEIETDKATMELEAYDSGVLTRILAASGTTVAIGEPIAVIGKSGDEASGTGGAIAEPTPAAVGPVATTAAGPKEAAPKEALPPPSPPPTGIGRLTSPLARAVARQHGLDLSQVTGTGPGGRIVRADVEAAVVGQPRVASTSSAPGPMRDVAVAPPTATAVPLEERVPLSAIRRITAQRLTDSAAAPHFHLISVVDVGALLGLRADLNGQLGESGPRVSVTDMLIRACAVVLRDHPQVNSSWGGDHLLRHGRINVGCAVAVNEGLIVPVIRDADRKPLTEIATEAHALADRARAGKLVPDEFTGGTFTISNLGMYGIDHFTAVINPPEAAILAVGAASDEPVLRDGQLHSVTRMKLTLSVDHRVLDGATGAAFLRDVVALLERPLRILV